MISISGLRVEFRRFALQDIDLDIETGDYFMLVGPTGAGKTLLLETIAGLHKVKSGEILIDDKDITQLEPEKRNIGMVYQDCALFPHLSVANNIAFGLKVRNAAEPLIKKVLGDIVSLVGVGHLLDRKPVNLSGGEKQKVALARALATRPRLLLLDEPLSALDPEGRDGLQRELKRIHRELGITVIHVTHDFDEALMLGKHIAVIGTGSIRQAGTPEEIFHRPDSEFVARFTMMRNILSGEFIRENENRSIFHTGSMRLVVKTPKEAATHACIRPDDVVLSTNYPVQNDPDSYIGTVTRIEDRGTAFHVFIDVPPEICCQVSHREFSKMDLHIGQNVKITLNPDLIHVF